MKVFTRISLLTLILACLGSLGLQAQQDNDRIVERIVQKVCDDIHLQNAKTCDHNASAAVRPDRPLIGIYVGHHEGNGIMIDGIVDGGGAGAAGLQDGDVITSINGMTIERTRDLQVALSQHQGGDQVQVQYLRDGQSRQANVTLKAKPNISADRPLIGIYPESIDGQGILVDDITAGGGAVQAGIRSGDVITYINADAINSMTDLKVALSKYQAEDQVQVQYLRDGSPGITQVTLQKRSERRYWSRERDPCKVFIGVSLGGRAEGGRGVYVSHIIEDTPAELYGVHDGDVILALDDVYVNSFNELLHERNKHEPGDWFTLKVQRGDQILDVDAQFKSCAEVEEEPEVLEEAPVVIAEAPEETAAPQEVIFDNTLAVDYWKAFPNPAFGQLNIQFQAEAVPTFVRLVDANGKAVYQENLNQFDGNFNRRIDLRKVTPGTYFLQVRQGVQTITEKIIVMPRA